MSRVAFRALRTLGVVAALIFAFQILQPQSTFAQGATITANPNHGVAGVTTVMVSGSGFTQGETVNIYFSGTTGAVATQVAGAGGVINTSFTVPAGATIGAHTITASGAVGQPSASTPFTVDSSTNTALTIQKSVAVNNGAYGTTGTAAPGSTLVYQIQYSNTGSNAANGVTITDTLAPGQTLEALSTGCNASTFNGSTTVTCGPFTAPAAPTSGSSGAFFIQVGVNNSPPNPITNTATISATNATSQTSNSTSVSTVPSTTGTEQLQKFVSDNGGAYTTALSAVPGDQLTYDLRYTNLSTTTSQSNVVVTDTLQPGQTLLAYPATSGYCTSYNSTTGQLTCTIPSIGPNTTIHVYVATQVNSGFSGTLQNTAQAAVGGVSVTSNTTTVQVGATSPTGFAGTFTLCGPITSYTGTSITISGVTVPVVSGAAVSGSIAAGLNECVSFTFNSAGQATALAASSNLAGLGVVCGVYEPTGNPSVISVSGAAISLQAGTTVSGVLNPGSYYCFLISSQGVAYAVLSGTPTSATQLGGGGNAGAYRHEIAF